MITSESVAGKHVIASQIWGDNAEIPGGFERSRFKNGVLWNVQVLLLKGQCYVFSSYIETFCSTIK